MSAGWAADLRAAAEARLPAVVARYFAAGAGEEITAHEASRAWASVRLTPRVLRGPVEVDLDLVDWAEPLMISADPAKVERFAAKITRRRAAGKRVKPVVMVQTPQRVLVVDGHHRALAFRHLGEPVTGYVGAVEADAGPWLTTHAQQLVDEVETDDAA